MSRTVATPSTVPERSSVQDATSAWVAEGIITQAQAERIRAREGGPVDVARPLRPSPPMSLVLEALGYLGGAIVVVATVLIAGRYWVDLGSTTRLGLLGLAAVALLVGGVVVQPRLEEVGARMRSVTWLVSTGAVAGFLGVWGGQVADLHGEDLALLVTAGTAAYASALFLLSRSLLQQVAMMGLLGGTAAALLARFDETGSWPGVGFWAVGAGWLVLGRVGLLRPEVLGRAAGAVMALIGSMMTTSGGADVAIVFSLATVAAVVVLAVADSDLALLTIGSLGAVQAIIAAVNEWFPNSVAAAVALLLVGGGLVATAIWIARRRAHGGTPAGQAR